MQPTQVITPECRLLFPVFFAPKKMKRNGVEQGEAFYSVLALTKNTPKAVELFKDAMLAAAKKEWPKRTDLSGLKLPVRSGEQMNAESVSIGKKARPEYEGMLTIYAHAPGTRAPEVVGMDRKPILDARKVYGGVYGYLSLNFKAGIFFGNPGVTCYVNHVMISRDGERLGGAASAEDAFAGIQDAGESKVTDEFAS